MVSINQLEDVANVLRRDVAIMTNHSSSGHPTSCFSCAEIISSLFFQEMRYDIHNPANEDSDEFILSKGHAAPILYSALYRARAIRTNLNQLRELHSSLQGHPIPTTFPWVKVATGSLGQGLSIGIGMAIAARKKDKKYRTYVLLGDSELAEGNVWEAFQIASYYNLSNLCAIIDVNRLGQSGETMLGYDLKSYKKRIKAFGWNTLIIDGHNISQIQSALNKARSSNKPTAIIAKTIKGRGVSFLEDKEGWHGKVLDNRHLAQCLDELPHVNMPKIEIRKPNKINEIKLKTSSLILPRYKSNEEISTREAYGRALATLAVSNPEVIALDAEVSNSTYSEEVKKLTPGQFIEAFIAEQNMISMALGMSKKGLNVFASTFGSFLTRAYDQIRMSAYSNGNFTITGSHSGVSIGSDGASQMALEDISMFRTIVNSNIFYPSDGISTSKLVKLANNTKGINYIRTTRGKTPIIYNNDESFPLGEFKVVKQSKKDKAVLVGAGITLHESLKAQEELSKKNANVAVIDLYCIKPFNDKKFINFVKSHGNKVIITEDHYKQGGIGEMLSNVLKNTNTKISLLNVNGIPHSGSSEELLKKYRIDKTAIIEEFRKL